MEKVNRVGFAVAGKSQSSGWVLPKNIYHPDGKYSLKVREMFDGACSGCSLKKHNSSSVDTLRCTEQMNCDGYIFWLID